MKLDMNVIDCGGQRTEEWFNNHVGMLTSSRIADVIGKRKRNPAEPLQAYVDLRIELAVERLTKKPAQHFVSTWMERGIELEPLARAAYELRADREVNLVDFVLHPDRERLEWAGCSPDGITGEELIEIKVPKPETHAGYLMGEVVPAEYLPQMHWQMACTGAAANTFVSYCPDFPEPLDLLIVRLPRDEKRIAEMEAEAVKFLVEVAEMTERLKSGLAGQLRRSLHHPAADGAAALPSPKSTAAPSGASV